MDYIKEIKQILNNHSLPTVKGGFIRDEPDGSKFGLIAEDILKLIKSQPSTGGIDREALNPDSIDGIVEVIDENLKWISVEDRLPELMEGNEFLSRKVLTITNGNYQTIRCYDVIENVWTGTEININHWQPLPQPPTE